MGPWIPKNKDEKVATNERMNNAANTPGRISGRFGSLLANPLPLVGSSLTSIAHVAMAFIVALVYIVMPVNSVSAAPKSVPAAAPPCQFANEGGRLMDVWRELGGPNSALGCPIEQNERPGRENPAARIRLFANGEATWSPWTGDGAVLVAWREPGGIRIWWKYFWNGVHTDKWQINWINGSTELRNMPQNQGDFLLQGNPYQPYSVTVQSCRDPKGFGRSVCRGWMERVFMPEMLPGVRVELFAAGQQTVLFDDDRFLLNAINFAWGGSRVRIKDELRRAISGMNQKGFTAYAVEVDVAEAGEVRTRTENGNVIIEFTTRGNWVTAKFHTPWKCGRICNPGFRLTYDAVITLSAPLSNPPGGFRLTAVETRIENVKIDGTNLVGEIAEIVAPSAMREIVRGAMAAGHVSITDQVNAAITPLTAPLINNIPPGVVYLHVWVDGRGKLFLILGTP